MYFVFHVLDPTDVLGQGYPYKIRFNLDSEYSWPPRFRDFEFSTR